MNWSLSDALSFVAGVEASSGSTGSAYGGVSLSPAQTLSPVLPQRSFTSHRIGI